MDRSIASFFSLLGVFEVLVLVVFYFRMEVFFFCRCFSITHHVRWIDQIMSVICDILSILCSNYGLVYDVTNMIG